MPALDGKAPIGMMAAMAEDGAGAPVTQQRAAPQQR